MSIACCVYLVCLGITVLFGQTEIDDVDLIRFFAEAHQELNVKSVSIWPYFDTMDDQIFHTFEIIFSKS
jgi:hypothetical protein